MGTVFSIPAQVLVTLQQGFTDIVTAFGKPIQLFYPGLQVPCVNCVPDMIGNKGSNKYKNGGPQPFNMGFCPMCNGSGTRVQTVTEVVTAIILWDPADYIVVNPNIRLPDGSLQTKHLIADMPKLLRCTDMQIQGPVSTMNHYNFQPNGEPFEPGNIVQSVFCLQNWKRSG